MALVLQISGSIVQGWEWMTVAERDDAVARMKAQGYEPRPPWSLADLESPMFYPVNADIVRDDDVWRMTGFTPVNQASIWPIGQGPGMLPTPGFGGTFDWKKIPAWAFIAGGLLLLLLAGGAFAASRK